ncbi:M20 family metallo-hydrolase [Pectobacterium parmentieri]|uniref:Acetylornithine deacetylase or succinyl-diaminopimelate desuccinylase n=2 Tax=Pectobacterium parmentieri TaxID=1905730 RepID=A0A0H3I1W7_PECPM|nr:M20 family metallo-hydrolase [Pectobacterium parmentieri]AFI89374.1 Acetylornithine deacetylase or succinyl-diaminopimelate desuccinylase [Pectobacterium parmentieri]AOR59630.1 hypothetical protein A8F97_12045 [Pectobacterium parmentieri]AYH00650.1 hypothetical protein C5E26_06665 [Pectobacterium parmentieri]AYH09374.1 hypothetical protein C5E24_06540 [Pectobacterium parmentieri]AYH19863.1 hypothetical protein C5E22_15980 [Pectobacterium parmentieri]
MCKKGGDIVFLYLQHDKDHGKYRDTIKIIINTLIIALTIWPFIMNKLLSFIAQREGEAINLHRELVRRPAINPEHGGEGEETKARWIEEWLYHNGLCRVQRMDALDVQANNKLRPNLVAHFLPPECKHTLWLVTHMDIAAPGPLEHWVSDPFILRVDGDRLYGRGVEDNNQGIVSALLLLDAVKQLKITPPMGIGIIFTSAGITDYTKGIGHILNKTPQLFRTDDLIVVPDYGNENGSIIEIGEKRNAWVRIDVKGREYHAGFSEGPNCFEAAARFIYRLKHVRRRHACPDPFFFPPTSTITPTHSETNCTGLNHVPANFVFYLDIRLMPNCGLELVMEDLQQLARLIEKQEKVLFTFSYVEITPDAPITSGHSPVIRILSDAIEKELGVTPRLVGVGGVTMVSVIRSLGLPVAVWGIQQSSKNQINESISLKAQLEQTRIFARMLYASPLKLSKVTVSQSLPCEGAKNITPAEQSVAMLVGLGMNNENIGEQLNLSVNTIRTHLKNLYRKTGARNRRELQRLFILK